jgi:O-antigen/teichoic acid export membrane protein
MSTPQPIDVTPLDPPLSPDLTGQAARGAAWMGLSRWANQALSLGVFVVLGRLLTPAAFGLVATASVVLWLLRVLVDQGFSGVIIQRSTLTREHIDTAFWTSLGTGIVLAGVTSAVAPLLARAYGQPALTAILRVLSLVFIIAALDATQSALLSRDLRFREQAIRLLVANVASAAVALFLAFDGAGVWALVGQTLALESVSVVLLWSLASWKPALRFSRQCFTDMFGFGTQMMMIRMLTSVGAYADNFLIGLVIGPVALGYYVIAFRVVVVINEVIATALLQVVLSTFSRLQHDLRALNDAFYRASGLVAAASFPIYGGLALLAKPVIILVFGNKWAPSAPVMQALTLAGLVQCQTLFTSQYVVALGKVTNELRWTAGIVTAELAGFALAVPFGIVSVALSLSIVLLVALPIRLRQLRAWGGLRISAYLKPYPGLVTAMLVMAGAIVAIGHLMTNAGGVARLCAEITGGAASYGVSLRLFAGEQAREIRTLVAQLRGRS